jgi:hypothetical protein
MKIPRKKKKQIPEGVYCYTSTSGFKELSAGKWGYTIKLCDFYSNVKIKELQPQDRPEWIKDNEDYVISWCKLVKREIDDQCKSCGLKYGKFK